MRKEIYRFVALLLVPSLLADPVATSAIIKFNRLPVATHGLGDQGRFDEEALAEISVVIPQLLREITRGHPIERLGTLLKSFRFSLTPRKSGPDSKPPSKDTISRKITFEMLTAIGVFLGASPAWNLITQFVLSHFLRSSEPLFQTLSLVFISVLSSSVAAFFEERIEAHHHQVDGYSWKRLKALGKQILEFMVLGLFLDVLWVVFIYLGVLPQIPNVWSIPSEWISAPLDTFLLAPLLWDRNIYYIGKRLFNKLNHRDAVDAVKKEFFIFYCQVLPVAFICTLVAMYAKHHPLISYSFMNVDVIWWDLVWARAMRPNPQIVRESNMFVVARFFHRALRLWQRFDKWGWQGHFIAHSIFGLSVGSIAYLFYFLHFPAQLTRFFMAFSLIGWWSLLGFLHLMKTSPETSNSQTRLAGSLSNAIWLVPVAILGSAGNSSSGSFIVVSILGVAYLFKTARLSKGKRQPPANQNRLGDSPSFTPPNLAERPGPAHGSGSAKTLRSLIELRQAA